MLSTADCHLKQCHKFHFGMTRLSKKRKKDAEGIERRGTNSKIKDSCLLRAASLSFFSSLVACKSNLETVKFRLTISFLAVSLFSKSMSNHRYIWMTIIVSCFICRERNYNSCQNEKEGCFFQFYHFINKHNVYSCVHRCLEILCDLHNWVETFHTCFCSLLIKLPYLSSFSLCSRTDNDTDKRSVDRKEQVLLGTENNGSLPFFFSCSRFLTVLSENPL